MTFSIQLKYMMCSVVDDFVRSVLFLTIVDYIVCAWSRFARVARQVPISSPFPGSASCLQCVLPWAADAVSILSQCSSNHLAWPRNLCQSDGLIIWLINWLTEIGSYRVVQAGLKCTVLPQPPVGLVVLWVLVLHCGFGLYFLNYRWGWVCFQSVGHIHFLQVAVQISCPFFLWMLINL